MHLLLALLRWFAPALVIPLSYLSFRYVPWRRARLWAYFVLLVSLAVFDLFRLSFTSELADLFLRQAVLFMVGEFVWLIALIRSRWATVTAAVLVALLWVAANRDWLGAGPHDVAFLWRSRPAAVHRSGSFRYVLEELHRPFATPPHRRFTLMKRRTGLPVERTIRSYATPEGYYLTEFGFTWGLTPEGVRVDLHAGPDTLWTLGEGL